jgi:hypothetical protein
MADGKKKAPVTISAPGGISRTYGLNPNYRKDVELPHDPPEFSWATIMYLRLTASGLIVRTAYWKTLDPNGRPQSESRVDHDVGEIILDRFPDKVDHPIGMGTRRPAPGGHGQRRYYDNIDDFRFSKRSRIYIYLNNGDDIWFDEHWPVTFSPYSAEDRLKPDDNTWTRLDQNKSFFNARRKSIANISETQLLYLENHLRGRGGEEIPEDWSGSPNPTHYSMNFNVWVRPRDGGRPIALVIDPDTGNGTGAPPPANP